MIAWESRAKQKLWRFFTLNLWKELFAWIKK